jgi:predicted Zn-dependent peptidase
LITASAIERTRGEIIEAHRERLASDPYLESFIAFDRLVFPDFPYGHPLIGSGEELMGLTEADVLAFRRAYYVPNNAVLTIVGAFDPVRTKELVARYFDSLPAGSDVPAPPRPEFRRASEAVVEFASIRQPSGSMGFRFYPPARDTEVLRILVCLLFEGETARLRSRLSGATGPPSMSAPSSTNGSRRPP